MLRPTDDQNQRLPTWRFVVWCGCVTTTVCLVAFAGTASVFLWLFLGCGCLAMVPDDFEFPPRARRLLVMLAQAGGFLAAALAVYAAANRYWPLHDGRPFVDVNDVLHRPAFLVPCWLLLLAAGIFKWRRLAAK